MIDIPIINPRHQEIVRKHFFQQLSANEQAEFQACRTGLILIPDAPVNGDGKAAKYLADRLTSILATIQFYAVSIDGRTMEISKGVKENFDPEIDEFYTAEDCNFIF